MKISECSSEELKSARKSYLRDYGHTPDEEDVLRLVDEARAAIREERENKIDYEFKAVVILDNEKLTADYCDLDDTYRIVREEFTGNGLHDISENDRELIFISLEGESGGYAAVGLTLNLIYDSWLKPYLIKMYWFERFPDGSVEVEEAVAIRRKSDRKHKYQ